MEEKDKRVRRFLTVVTILTLVIGSLIILPTKQAHAQVRAGLPGHTAPSVHPLTASCSGDGCDKLDPTVEGCNDASVYTAKEAQISGAAGTADAGVIADVELRYSPTCGVNWTRFTSFVANAKTVATIERLPQTGIVYLKYCTPDSCYAASDSGSTVNYTIYTNMVYAPTAVARACGTIVSGATHRAYTACVSL